MNFTVSSQFLEEKKLLLSQWKSEKIYKFIGGEAVFTWRLAGGMGYDVSLLQATFSGFVCLFAFRITLCLSVFTIEGKVSIFKYELYHGISLLKTSRYEWLFSPRMKG